MPTVVINTTPEERTKVLEALKLFKSETVAVAAIARKAGLSHSRTNYAIMDLVDEGIIKRIPTKAIHKHYVRYKYEIIGGIDNGANRNSKSNT